jgi:serine/threonine protein phosphatase PrpC
MLMLDGIAIDAAGGTDIGKVRTVNEDQFLIAALHKVIDIHGTSLPEQYRTQFHSGARAVLLLVADGVGGTPAGERASSITLDAIMNYVTHSMRCFYALDQQAAPDLLHELAGSVLQSHEAVLAQAAESPEDAGMATTLTMAHVLWPRAYVVHIGDSRCYRLRGDQLELVTRDQTLSQALVETGEISEEQALHSPFASVLTQAVGGPQGVEPAISQIDLVPGDTLLLCTDGLTKHVTRADMAPLLTGAASAADAARALIDAALTGGGTDNVTVVVARLTRPTP